MCLLPFALLAAGAWTAYPLPFTLVNGETAKKALPATMPGGFAVFDFDNDGRLDLYFPNGGEPRGSKKAAGKLLRNVGGFRFLPVHAAGVEGKDYEFGAAAADYDGDGKVDLLVSGLRGVTLYRNLGGRFADVTAKARLDNKGRWSVAAVWLDMDADGDLDLFVVNYVRWEAAKERECIVGGKPDFCHPRYYEPQPNALFSNNGDGTFTDVSVESGIDALRGKGMSAAVADFDQDGRPDLFVTNDKMFAFLFMNQGGGKFVEAAFDWSAAVPREGNTVSGMGVDAEDFDNDGLPDLIYTALQDETFPLLRNTGKEFVELPGMGPVTRSMAGWGVAFADLDNDGWKDIAVARSGALSGRSEPLSWLRNGGDGNFMAQVLHQSRRMYRGLVAADFDNDGCLDIAVTALNSQAQILQNPCAGGNWLKVHSSGARVRVGNQWREASPATGYASSYAGPLHFGLGSATQVEVEIDGKIHRAKANTEVRR